MPKITEGAIGCVSAQSFVSLPRLLVSEMPGDENHHRFNVVLKGLSHIDDGSARYTAGPGDVIYFPPQFSRTEWNDPKHPLHCIVVLFDWPDAPADLPRLTQDDGGRLRQIASWLYDDMTFRPRSWRTRIGLMTAMVSEYMTILELAATSDDDRLVVRARRYVHENLAAPPSLDELAAYLGMDKQSLIRRYRAVTGTTPMRDARRHRLDQARMLLKTTSHTVGEVAGLVGFRCPFHFSRAYRIQFDEAPSTARKRVG